MIGFIIFLLAIGVTVELFGLFSSLIPSWLHLNEPIGFIVQFVIMASLFIIYQFALDKFFLKLYKDMKLTYKTLSIKDKLTQKGTLFVLMSFHYYGLSWLEVKVDNLLHFSVLVLFVSFFLGIAIKGIFDDTYQIKMTKESEKMIYEG
jgi:Na+-transporting NADH:ubiquinone oxidoreductase subunit NqrD